MVDKIIYFCLLILSTSCTSFIGDKDSNPNVEYFKIVDREDCPDCISAYFFYYDSSIHYNEIQYGLYFDNDGFLQDSVRYTFIHKQVKPQYISDEEFLADTIRFAASYQSSWFISYDIKITKAGECELNLYTPDSKYGAYRFELSKSEYKLVAYAVTLIDNIEPCDYISFDKHPDRARNQAAFLYLRTINRGITKDYFTNYYADDVSDEFYFFGCAIGAITQNHIHKAQPSSDTIKDTYFDNLFFKKINAI